MRLRPFLLSALLVLASCGKDPTVDVPSPLAGPPAWWAAREQLGERMDAIHLRAGGPCEIVLAVAGLDTRRRALPPRRLAAGETVRIWWVPTERALGAAPAAETAAGRTESHVEGLTFGFQDRSAAHETTSLWARPEHGRVRRASVLPPSAPEALAFGREVELAIVAVADLEPGRELRLVPRPEGYRVEPDPEGVRAPEQARVLRLTMVVRPVGE